MRSARVLRACSGYGKRTPRSESLEVVGDSATRCNGGLPTGAHRARSRGIGQLPISERIRRATRFHDHRRFAGSSRLYAAQTERTVLASLSAAVSRAVLASSIGSIPAIL